MRACRRSEPCVRAVATNRAKPVLASQAEKARRIMGEEEKLVESRFNIQRESAMKRESIIPSRHNNAESR